MQVTGGYLAYYNDLLFYRGAMTAEELLSASEDRFLPARDRWFRRGQLVSRPRPGFGRIAAEAELKRLGTN